MRHTILLASLAALACSPSSPTVRSSDPGDDASPADFAAAPAGTSSAPAGATSPPTVVPSPGRLEVLGLISTPNPCHDVRGAMSRNADTITVTVTATAREVICITVIGSFAYRISDDVPAGTYDVRVVHAYDGSGWPDDVAFDGTVTIP